MSDDAETKYMFLTVVASRRWMPIEYIEEKFSEEYQLSICRPIDISKEMQEFILTNCRCSHCKLPVQSFGRCSCGQYPEPVPIIVEFPTILYEPIFEKILFEQLLKEKYKRKALNRKIKLENAGKYTKAQIDLLFVVQEKSCYYCASNLVKDDGKRVYHIDHYVSLAYGGRNEVSNLVLACPACNLAKGIQDGNSFTRSIKNRLDLDCHDRAKKIRVKVRAYKKLKINNI